MANTRSIRRNRAAAKLAARRTLRRYTLSHDDFTLSFVDADATQPATTTCTRFVGLRRDESTGQVFKVYAVIA